MINKRCRQSVTADQETDLTPRRHDLSQLYKVGFSSSDVVPPTVAAGRPGTSSLLGRNEAEVCGESRVRALPRLRGR